MPKSRVKACEQCRVAKSRCSLLTPCTRCAKRGLDCHYDLIDRSRKPDSGLQRLRRIQPAKVSLPCPAKDGSALPTQTTGSSGPANGHSEATSTGNRALGVRDVSASFDAADLQIPDMDVPSDFMPELFDLPDSFDLPPFSFNFDMPLSTSDSSAPPEAQLEQRPRSFQQGALTAKLLFSKLASYSHLMADAVRLPPFIYPACWLGRVERCADGSPHRCLPEPLAVCSNLAQMFYLRRDGSEGFVWQQICNHLKQLRDKVSLSIQTVSDSHIN